MSDSKPQLNQEMLEGGRDESKLEGSEFAYALNYRALFDQSNDGIVLISLDRKFLAVNRRTEEISGYSAEELVGESVTKFIAPDELADAAEKHQQLKEGSPLPVYERIMRRKDGSTFPVEINLMPVKDAAGNLLYYQSITRDISKRKQAEKALRESEDRYRALFEQSNDGVFISELNGLIRNLNPRAADLLGYQVDELIDQPARSIISPDEYSNSEQKLAVLLEGKSVPTYERNLLHKNGRAISTEINLTLVLDSNRKPVGIQRIVRDISERKKADELIQENINRYRALFEQSGDAIFIINTEGFITDANHSVIQLFGYEYEEILQKRSEDLVADFEKQDSLAKLKMALIGMRPPVYERTCLRKDGSTFPAEINLSPVRGAEGKVRSVQSIVRDISSRRAVEQQLHHLATHDALTGLPNRALFFDRLQQALVRARRGRLKVAVLFIDLDGFKLVNDTYGHAMGDRLLEAITKRLEICFRGSDTLARMGGDEFTVILENITDLKQAISLAERVLLALAQPFFLKGYELSVSASMGLSMFPEDGEDGDFLVNCADHAMYAAKNTRKGGLMVSQFLDRENSHLTQMPGGF